METRAIKQNEYTWSAKYYDQLCNESVVQDDIQFYKSFLNERSSVLELGCGTGRAGIELAKVAKKYVGIDLSPQMLNVFQEKINGREENISLYQYDMTEFHLGNLFDLIIFPFRSFQALTSDNQRNKCLELCAKHLNKGGHVIIQMFNPDFDKLDNFAELKIRDGKIQDGEYKVERLTIGKDHDKLKQTIQASYVYEVYKDDCLIKSVEEPLYLGYMNEDQARRLFKNLGFEVTAVYKWWDFSKVDEEKKELIFVLKCET